MFHAILNKIVTLALIAGISGGAILETRHVLDVGQAKLDAIVDLIVHR